MVHRGCLASKTRSAGPMDLEPGREYRVLHGSSSVLVLLLMVLQATDQDSIVKGQSFRPCSNRYKSVPQSEVWQTSAVAQTRMEKIGSETWNSQQSSSMKSFYSMTNSIVDKRRHSNQGPKIGQAVLLRAFESVSHPEKEDPMSSTFLLPVSMWI